VPVAVAPARPRCFPKEPIWGCERAYFAIRLSLFRILKEPILEREIGSFDFSSFAPHTILLVPHYLQMDFMPIYIGVWDNVMSTEILVILCSHRAGNGFFCLILPNKDGGGRVRFDTCKGRLGVFVRPRMDGESMQNRFSR